MASIASSSKLTSSSAIKRFPLKQAITNISSGEGSSTILNPRLKSININYLPKNSPSGPREFVNTILPRIAYHNPTIPISVNRIKDPRSKTLNEKSRDFGLDMWENGKQPDATLSIEIDGSSELKSSSISNLNSSQILSKLLELSGSTFQQTTNSQSSQEQGRTILEQSTST